MSDIKLEALDCIDDHRLSLTMADIKACTQETTNPSSSLATEDIKQEPLADDYNEHLSSNRTDLNVVDSTDQKTSLSTLFRTTDVKCEPLEIDFNQQLPSHSINLQEDNFLNKNEHMSFIFPMTENQPLNINDYAKEYDNGSFSDGQLYLTENKDFGMEEIIVANDELPSEKQFLQNTNITLNEENKSDNTENKKDDIDHLPNLSTVQNQIEVENIDQTSDILHEQKQKQIETDDIYLTGSNNKIENIHQTSDLLQGQKQPKIRIITNRSFTYCNHIKNQPHVIRIKKVKVQDETPTLNHFQETIGEYEQTTSMHNFLCGNSYLEHDHNYYNMPKEERKTENPRKEKQISSVHNFLSYLEHDHNYYNMPKEERKAENRRKEKQANILRAQTEEKPILKKQRNEEKLKAKEEKRKISLQPVPCPICGKMIRPRHMSRHKSTQHSGESFLCKFCGMLFQSRKEVTHHEILNHDVGPKESKQCDICHKTFKSRRVMREHRTRIHIKKRKHTFLCSICGKNFPALYDLNRHTRTHSDEKPFKCHHCDAEFKVRSRLLRHIVFSHFPRKILSCTESGCERKYISKDGLRRHVEWHRTCKTEEVSHHEMTNHDDGLKESKQCDICHKTFESRSLMLGHRSRFHINKRKHTFVCSICGKKFPFLKYLNSHTQTHSDEKPFKCHHCDAEFKLRSYLQKHIGFCHVPKKILLCTESGCERKYSSKDGLRRHVKWHRTCKTDTSQIHTT